MTNNQNLERLKGIPALLKKLKQNLETILTKDDIIFDAINSDQYSEVLDEAEALVKKVKHDLKKHPTDLASEDLDLVNNIERNIINLGRNLHQLTTTHVSTAKREHLITDCYKDIKNAIDLIED